MNTKLVVPAYVLALSAVLFDVGSCSTDNAPSSGFDVEHSDPRTLHVAD